MVLPPSLEEVVDSGRCNSNTDDDCGSIDRCEECIIVEVERNDNRDFGRDDSRDMMMMVV